MKTLNELEQMLAVAREPKDLFGDEPDKTKTHLLASVHPDRHLGEESRASALFDKINKLFDQLKSPPTVIKSPKREYRILKLLVVGDVADLHLATSTVDGVQKDYVLKVSRVVGGDKLLETEQKHLAKLLTAAATGTYSHYLPLLVESFLAKDKIQKRVNVFPADSGFYTLEQVHAKHPELDGRHLAWIFKRLLTVLGFAKQQGVVHGAVLPAHIRLDAKNHGLQLVGWGQSVAPETPVKVISSKWCEWYPQEVLGKKPVGAETDLLMGASCMVYLSGGDPMTGQMPKSVPVKISRFIQSCLLDGRSMRPPDPWDLLEEFDDTLKSVYGKPRFHKLEI